MEIIEQHYRENFDRLSKQWGRRFDNPHIGQDVVQEAYLRAIKYKDTYDPAYPFPNWFGRILQNSFRDIRAEEVGHTHDEIDEFALSGEENHHEVDRLIQQIIDRIQFEKPEHREVLRYAFQGGYSAKEISQFLDVNHRMARKIIGDYRNKVRKMLN